MSISSVAKAHCRRPHGNAMVTPWQLRKSSDKLTIDALFARTSVRLIKLDFFAYIRQRHFKWKTKRKGCTTAEYLCSLGCIFLKSSASGVWNGADVRRFLDHAFLSKARVQALYKTPNEGSMQIEACMLQILANTLENELKEMKESGRITCLLWWVWNIVTFFSFYFESNVHHFFTKPSPLHLQSSVFNMAVKTCSL